MQKLKSSQIAPVRTSLLSTQNGKCAVCSGPCSATLARLDHCHTTGAVRGTLCNGCNALLGKVENNAPRFGVRNLSSFLHGAAAYLQKHMTNITGLIHPLHLTEDEKRVRRNTKARAARAAKKL